MKKVASIILALMMLASLAACGSKDLADKNDDPNVVPSSPISNGDAGHYVLVEAIEDGETITGDELREMGFDYYVLLNEDGTVECQTDDLATGTWGNGVLNLHNEKGETATIDYKIEGDELTLDWDGLIMIYSRGSDVSSEQIISTEGLSKVQQWWDGDWYGYWETHSVTDDYRDMEEDERWECYAEIQMNPDDTGTIYLWEKLGDIAMVDIRVSKEGGSGDMGAAVSESGHHWNDVQIGHADWIIDPSLYGYENYMVIDGRYEDEENPGEGFSYVMYLRPWGQLWDDIPEDDRPPDYEDWYLDNYTAESMTEMVLASITDYDGYDDSERDGPDTEGSTPPVPAAGVTVDVGYEMEEVNISAMLPTNWCSEKNAFGVNFYNVADLEDTHSGSPRIRVNIKAQVKDFDVYIESFENIQNIENRTIGGIDMAGRTYEFVGMDWIEYTGVIGNEHAVSVSISKIDINGEEAKDVLDSIKLELR
ncbi:MAG TPA: hypothetical protein VFD57_07280 [Clostridia bacterium]|nr:hypothetical protein [Clostridia bacterium]